MMVKLGPGQKMRRGYKNLGDNEKYIYKKRERETSEVKKKREREREREEGGGR